MKLHKIHYRNEKLDTQFCYCINNYLWAKDLIQILNDEEFLAPKYYTPRHVSQLENRKLANARYRARNPLKLIKKSHEDRPKRQRRPKELLTKRIYKFAVNVDEDEYRALWNFLYKELRDPIKDKSRVETIEEKKERLKKKNDEK